MKRVALLLICAVLLSAGCVEKNSKNSGGSAASAAPGKAVTEKGIDKAAAEPLSAVIISPKAGEILSRNSEFKFDSIVKGGKEPYTYSWTSNMQSGVLSTDQSFTKNLSKLNVGEHNIILKVTDASGNSAEASVVALIL